MYACCVHTSKELVYTQYAQYWIYNNFYVHCEQNMSTKLCFKQVQVIVKSLFGNIFRPGQKFLNKFQNLHNIEILKQISWKWFFKQF